MQQYKSRRNLFIIILISCVLIIAGFAWFLHVVNEGNRWLSGNSHEVFVNQTEVEATFNDVLDAFNLDSTISSAQSERPYYAFGYNRDFYSGSVRWWTRHPGYVKDAYTSVSLDRTLLAASNKKLLDSGWQPLVKSGTSVDVLGELQKSIIEREQSVQRKQQSAEQPYCVKSEYCQQQHNESLNELNDKPLEVLVIYTKGLFSLKLSYSTYDIKTADLAVALEY